MSGSIIIGIDHGYAAMKTVHFSFPTGLVEYEHEPYTQKDVLEYGGRYYVVGSGRQPLQRDKTQTEDYYLLTLAAIAKELEHRGAEHTASIHLAAGLPLTSFGRDKKSFRSYLYRDGSAIPFRYEGQDYTITIQEVSLFPQGYAAVLTQTELLDEPSVIVADIGGWTVDLMRLDNRIPNAASCRSLELGMIRCIDEISEQVRRLFGLSMTTAQIESALRGSSGGMDERIRAVIHAQAGKYARNLLSAVTESGLDIRAMPTIFLGGGAALLKRHLSATDGLCRPLILDDISLNAKGYSQTTLCNHRGERSGVLLIKEATKRGYKEAMVGDTVDLGYAGSNTRRGRVGRDIAHTLETSCIQGIVERGGRIRRLMPRESLRLQGFAEEQIDKILAITSDAQAYKQAGNSVTITVIEAIGRRIRAVDEELRGAAA